MISDILGYTLDFSDTPEAEVSSRLRGSVELSRLVIVEDSVIVKWMR